MQYSQYQLDIFAEVKQRGGNVAINAVAGSGKTSTCIKSLEYIPSIYNVQFCAFGKDIAQELRSKNPPKNVSVATYNAFGWKILRDSTSQRLNLNEKNEKTQLILQHEVLKAKEEDEVSWKKYLKFRAPVNRIVSLLKSTCVFNEDVALGEIPRILEHYQIDAPTTEDFIPTVIDTYMKCILNHSVYDYDDQVFQVLFQDLEVPKYDFTFVDEFQDTNEMQARLMMKATDGRFFGIGDPDQSIYGFRGASPGAFDKFVQDFKAKIMPLSICYRCPKSVVLEAQKIVPRIEYAPWAREGVVDRIQTAAFLAGVRPGDFVLCRTVAPLVKRCLESIRNGIPAIVFGRDIGDQLEYLIDTVSRQSNFLPVTQFRDLLEEYVLKKMEYYEKMKMTALALALDDKSQTILALMEDCRYVSDIKKKISTVFSDKNSAHVIKYMTVHKSKGLECHATVWLLRPDLIPHPRSTAIWMKEEEQRLMYVAITRTQDKFFYVEKERGER